MNYLIGCGGVGSAIVPSFCLLKSPTDITLIDGDTIERKNLNRQMFEAGQIGKNKAQALAARYGCHALPEWFARGKLRQLSRASAGLTGAEIEAVFLEAMFSAFERSKEPTDLDVASALNDFVPLSRLMAEQIAALKQWSINRARPATSHSTASEPTLRKLGV